MPDGNQVATASNRDLATMRFEDALETYSPNFAAVLPPDVALEHFKRMVVTAVNQNPDLRYADRRTFFNACVKCASDGVLPDGREAALVVFKTKVKDREGRERSIDAVNYMIMVAGIRKRLRNTGEVLSAEAEVVFANDHFHYRLGDDPMIDHRPAPLDQDPGDIVGAYAIIKLTNGEIIREVVRRRDIDRARGASKAPNSPAWRDWYDQMARKVALRRCAKAAPASSSMMRSAPTLDRLLSRDDEPDDLPPAEELPAIPPRPRREDFVDHDQADPGEVVERPHREDFIEREPAEEVREAEDWGAANAAAFYLVDTDGVEHAFEGPDGAAVAMDDLMRAAAKERGYHGEEAVWESNGKLISDLRAAGRGDLAEALHATRSELTAEHNSYPGPRQERPQPDAPLSDSAGGETYPTRAAVIDPERKPSEGRAAVPVDEAGGSSETNARPTSGGRRDGGERPAPVSPDHPGEEGPAARLADAKTAPPRGVAHTRPAVAPRDEKFWAQEKLEIKGATPKEILYYANQYLRQCWGPADIDRIEEGAAQKVAQMSPRDQTEFRQLIVARRRELAQA